MSNRREDSALAQQARKAAFMYGGPLQALRANVARASALGDEAQPCAHMTVGTEPSSSHSALPFPSRVKGNSRFENEGATVAAGHASPAGTGKLPCTAQLTVFYAGMVNVYEDVPADKVSHGLSCVKIMASVSKHGRILLWCKFSVLMLVRCRCRLRLSCC
jgi:hypothetical protein